MRAQRGAFFSLAEGYLRRSWSEKVTEMQENIWARQETLRVAYEKIKKLRADLVQEGESMDKNRSHVLSRRAGGSTKPNK